MDSFSLNKDNQRMICELQVGKRKKCSNKMSGIHDITDSLAQESSEEKLKNKEGLNLEIN